MYKYTAEILKNLEDKFQKLETELIFNTPYQLLVATILSAQTTDKQVNKVTKTLFANYPTAYDMIKLDQEKLEEYIKTCGFYRNKSKNILATSKILIDKYDGEIPDNLDELIKLPGVGRKTANVVISNAYGIPAIAVDTHVFRVSNRLGLANATTVEEVEQQLMLAIPKDKWSLAHHWLIKLGREICNARKPKCSECYLKKYCKDYNSK